MRLKSIFECPVCCGSGQEYVNVFRRSDPSQGWAYVEFWETCSACKGTGRAKHLHIIWAQFRDWWVFRVGWRFDREEDVIPF